MILITLITGKTFAAAKLMHWEAQNQDPCYVHVRVYSGEAEKQQN